MDFLNPTQLAGGLRFNPETVDSLEAGLKGSVLGQRVQYDLAVFQNTHRDYQVSQFILLGSGAGAYHLRNAAKMSGAVTVNYTLNSTALRGRLDLYGECSFRSEAEADLAAPIREIDARTVINAHIGYTPNGARWTLGLWIRNLADEDYMLARNQDLFGNQFVKHGDPRMFGADLQYNF